MTPISSEFPSLEQLGTGADIATSWQSTLQPFWHAMQTGTITTTDNLTLRYYFHQVPAARHAVVISSGRVEMALKYAELCFELVQAGYSVFLLDHRGQGLSQRELANSHKGYVADFTLYQQDLVQFVQHIVLPTNHSSHIAIGHSMGCAILAGYLQQQPHPFRAAVLASPMFGIYTGLVPTRFAESLALAFGAINRSITKTPWYFPGQGNYNEKPFSQNPLTTCPERYQWLLKLYQEQPQSQLGGVTTAWVSAAINAMQHLQRDAAKWHTPVLMLQAAADKVVSNAAQNNWFEQLNGAVYHQQITLPGARHEIFMEQDGIRQTAFSAINHFLAGLPPTP